MVATVGAVGDVTCRVSGVDIDSTAQSFSLTGCQLDPGGREGKRGEDSKKSGGQGKVLGF